jgi:ABC-2 type transport system ATP-binding protein
MLSVRGIKKVYKNGRGLCDLSFDVEKGEIICLIGPNGSGKSTALNIIAGISKGDEGVCLLNGKDTGGIPVKRDIGFLEETAFYYEHISVDAFLNFIWGVKYSGEPNGEVIRLLENFDMTMYRDAKMSDLSQGYKKRVGLISALMHHPELIILDEPLNGLDTRSVIKLKEEILLARYLGCIVIISSHILDFLKDIGTRIIFLKDGNVVENIMIEPHLNLDDIYKEIYM